MTFRKSLGLPVRVKKNCRSLEYAIDFLKIEKTESFHRALHDAWYTAEVFAKLPIEVVEEKLLD